ncbi:MAG: glutathione synthase [Arenicellales bacterium WSBS_2016_MAG_OTU3]
MQHAFIMNPLEGVNTHKDTTYFLMLAACERGHDVFYLDQHSLFLDGADLRADISHVTVHADIEKPFTVLQQGVRSLGEMDFVWIRTDPPFDRRYFYTTLLLDFLPATTRVLNNPQGIRDWNEKLAATHYPELTPATLVANGEKEIIEFAKRHDRITLKPVDGHGGEGIEFAGASDADLTDKIKSVTQNGSHWIIVQEYLRAANKGDKRILLLNGEPLGGILRLHAEGVELNNLDAGGSANPTELTERDLEICAAIKQGLMDKGVFFAGIDVIGGRLIEVNVTSPTGLQEMCRFSGVDHHHSIVAALEK